MGTDINHAAGEALVSHRWHRNEHLPVEIAALGAFARPGFGRFSLCPVTAYVRIAAGGNLIADVFGAWFLTDFHDEMLPDWMPIANAGFRVSHDRRKHSSCHNSQIKPCMHEMCHVHADPLVPSAR